MPILRGERLIGEIDARVHRQQDRLHLRALRLERGVRVSDLLCAQLHRALGRLAGQCGADQVTFAPEVRARLGSPI